MIVFLVFTMLLTGQLEWDLAHPEIQIMIPASIAVLDAMQPSKNVINRT
jgi:hypothetical protein